MLLIGGFGATWECLAVFLMRFNKQLRLFSFYSLPVFASKSFRITPAS